MTARSPHDSPTRLLRLDKRTTVVRGLVVLLLVGSLSVATASATPAASSSRPDSWFSDSVVSGRDGAVALLAAYQLRGVVRQRGAAISAGSQGQFASGLAPAVRRSQLQLFDRMRAVPFTTYTTAVASGFPSAKSVLSGEISGRVRIRYRVVGDQLPTVGVVRATFVRAGTSWVLSSWHPIVPDLWDLGPVRTVRSGPVLVMGDASTAALTKIAASSRRALRAVKQVWPYAWRKRVTVMYPRTDADMAAMLDMKASELRNLAAVTTGEGVTLSKRGQAIRVTLTPAYYFTLGELGHQVLLRHEFTHVAQRGLDRFTTGSVPSWLREGLAEYVGYLSSGVPFTFVASDLLSQVRAGTVPSLPDDSQFGFDRPGVNRELAYRAGWSVCVYIAQRFGQDKLFAVYREVTQGYGTGDQRFARAVRQVLGVGQPNLLRGWQAWLRRQA